MAEIIISWIYLSNEGGIHRRWHRSYSERSWIYLSNEGGIHLGAVVIAELDGWIYLSNEGGIHRRSRSALSLTVGYTFQMRVVYTYLLESNFLTYI